MVTVTHQPPPMTAHDPPQRDKVIADTGWGIKPDDQPANAADASGRAEGVRGCRYDPDEPDAVKAIARRQRQTCNTANRVVVEPGRTTIIDINGDAFVVEGLSFASPHLVELLKALGAAFDPRQLAALGPDFTGRREYALGRAWAWGAERTG